MPPHPRVPAPQPRAIAHWQGHQSHQSTLPPSRVTRAAARLSSVVGLRASRASHPALLRSFLVGHAAASAGPGATASRYRALAGPPIPPIHPPSLPRDTSCRKAELRGRPQCLARLPHPALPRSRQWAMPPRPRVPAPHLCACAHRLSRAVQPPSPLPASPRDTSCRKAELCGRPQCLACLPHPALRAPLNVGRAAALAGPDAT